MSKIMQNDLFVLEIILATALHFAQVGVKAAKQAESLFRTHKEKSLHKSLPLRFHFLLLALCFILAERISCEVWETEKFEF